MPVPRYRFFSASDAAAMSRLAFTARQVVEGVLTGQHRSPHRGFSVEFSEHRDYSPGDEIRHLDWKAYARSDRYFIKLFEQETNLRGLFIVDTSRSMGYAGKLDYSKHLTACLGYLLVRQQDWVGLLAADEQVRVDLPAGGSASHLDRFFKHLETLTPRGSTDLPRHLHDLAERAPRRSLFVLISDLWCEPEHLARAFQHVRYKRHALMILHLLDRTELTLPDHHRITLEDLETGERVEIDTRQIRNDYRQQVSEHLNHIRQAAHDGGAEYHRLWVHTPYHNALLNLLDRT